MEASVVTDRDVIDSITESAEGEVVAVHAVDLTFTDENGETVQPAEGSQVSVALSAGEGESDDARSTGTGENAAAAEQDTETTVIQYTEENGAEPIETNDGVSFRVEPDNDLDEDNAVSFDMSEQAGSEESQTYAIVETVPENDVKEESFTEAAEEEDKELYEEISTEPGEDEDQAAPAEEALDLNEETVLTARTESYIVTVMCSNVRSRSGDPPGCFPEGGRDPD